MRQQKSVRAQPSFKHRVCAAGAVSLVALLMSGTALAEKADQEKPTNIAADHTESDDLHQIDVFTGNVILTKGSIILRSNKLLVHQDPEGYQSGVATWDGKTPVYFKQKREGFADQYMEGWAERIEYDEKSSLVKLYDHAIVKRLEGAKDADEARGDTITYNSDTEKYWVEAGKTQDRTYTVIQPKSTTPAAGAAPATALPGTPVPSVPVLTPPVAGSPGIAAPPAVPPVDLKPSDTLLTRPQ
jgi:lipopolysaccharide export system protein LptA